MNMQLSRADLRGLNADVADRLDSLLPPARPGKRHGAPFAKREEGRARRAERRQVRARKMAWLNS